MTSSYQHPFLSVGSRDQDASHVTLWGARVPVTPEAEQRLMAALAKSREPKPPLTADDLHPGLTLMVGNQGRCITPQTVKVIVHWVGPDAVHYRIEGTAQLAETTIERFLDIANG